MSAASDILTKRAAPRVHPASISGFTTGPLEEKASADASPTASPAARRPGTGSGSVSAREEVWATIGISDCQG
ncbi:hypothetical protein [Microbacterium sp. SORGH_AS_0862]|uniref:hypothetical protein n=1 Tax=Microbacterium sp. SORGH_AS_0862 TaxID=3041789 RepID=UPI00278CD47C|nr:hypothetical protein [Microbacterium sp. SORGH_AS_0862]MDQ1206910.1 hypothetical protein [Microbacterium sp. SORGH_AS_0862]